MIGFEMLGRRPAVTVEVLSDDSATFSTTPLEDNNQIQIEMEEINPTPHLSNTVVMFPTNGVGFGHFTRMLALAKRMKNLDKSLEVIFFTTMPTLHLLKSHGIAAHYISGPKHFANLETSDWNELLEEELTICFETHRPKTFIFDGAFPYRGMLRAIQDHPMQKVWVRRGMFRHGGTNIPVDSIEHFNLIVHPGDAISTPNSEISHQVDSLQVPPILLLDDSEILSRNIALKRLGIPLDKRVVYVQLGAGQINNINSEVRLTVEGLLEHPDVHVVVGESMLGARHFVELDRVHIIRDYPNMIYRNAFDFSIQAGGYNSFHESRQLGVPTLFYPNLNTGMDDQLARCRIAKKEGWGLVVEQREQKSIIAALDALFNTTSDIERESENGAQVLAEEIIMRMRGL
jgi:UDP:flavonoid glycosyltransferase YjiC (YdhE family)